MIIELTNNLLLENISFLKYENSSLDIHNDYNFKELSFEQNRMKISFNEISNNFKIIEFVFENIEVVKLKMIQFEVPDSITLDNFYRGKTELNETILEEDSSKRKYFYLDFLEDIQIELWCSRLYLQI